MAMGADVKLCRRCGPKRGPLPMSAFWLCTGSRDGHRNTCKTCCNALWPRRNRKANKGQVTEAERQLLFALLDQGLSHSQIAKRLGRSRQTIAGIIYRADPSKQPKPRGTRPKSAVPKPDDDHPSKKPRGKIKPGDPLWPVEAALLRDARQLKLLDERRKRLRAEWLSYRT